MYVNGDNISTGISLTDNVWHFICFTWTSTGGFYEVYLDGHLETVGKNLSRDGRIAANGSIIIGQEIVRFHRF